VDEKPEILRNHREPWIFWTDRKASCAGSAAIPELTHSISILSDLPVSPEMTPLKEKNDEIVIFSRDLGTGALGLEVRLN
jgi:hypothetical protein